MATATFAIKERVGAPIERRGRSHMGLSLLACTFVTNATCGTVLSRPIFSSGRTPIIPKTGAPKVALQSRQERPMGEQSSRPRKRPLSDLGMVHSRFCVSDTRLVKQRSQKYVLAIRGA